MFTDLKASGRNTNRELHWNALKRMNCVSRWFLPHTSPCVNREAGVSFQTSVYAFCSDEICQVAGSDPALCMCVCVCCRLNREYSSQLGREMFLLRSPFRNATVWCEKLLCGLCSYLLIFLFRTAWRFISWIFSQIFKGRFFDGWTLRFALQSAGVWRDLGDRCKEDCMRVHGWHPTHACVWGHAG